eukprot:1703478-Rhodomonas_salina.3
MCRGDAVLSVILCRSEMWVGGSGCADGWFTLSQSNMSARSPILCPQSQSTAPASPMILDPL